MGLLSGLGGAVGLPFVGSSALALGGQGIDIWAGRESAEDQRAYNAAEAQKAREFSERMSNTAYQRAVKDLRKAGINPMLAYMQGGASTPSSAVASSSPATTGSFSSALSAASQARKTESEIGLLEQTIDKTREQVGTARFERMTASQMYDILLRTMPDLEKRVKSEAARVFWEAEGSRLKIPAAEAEAEFWKSPLGESGVGKFLLFMKSILK